MKIAKCKLQICEDSPFKTGVSDFSLTQFTIFIFPIFNLQFFVVKN